MENNSGIYCIRDNINDRLYIGQSINLKRRKRKHFSELNTNHHVNTHLQRAYNKYGKENFEFKILLLCEKEDLTYYEDFFIKLFQTQTYGYNINDADSPPDNRGKRNGMYIVEPQNKRKDIDENIEVIADEYQMGCPYPI